MSTPDNKTIERLKQLALITDYLIADLPNCSAKEQMANWLRKSPYSPYITLYGGKNSKHFNKDKSFVCAVDNKERYSLEDKISFKLENFKSFDSFILSAKAPLENIINQKELFLCYPEFRNIEVSINISNSDNGHYSGSTYHSDGKAQRIEVFADSNENAMRVLLHELQHCIQLKEGFEIGESYYGDKEVMDLFVGTTTNSNGDYLEGAFSDIATRKSMREIDDSRAEIHFTHGKNPFAYESFYRKPLGELLSHDELYLHYPFLKDVKVTVVEQSVLKNTLGIFSDGLILLNESLFLKGNENELMDTLIHEIQHNIQEIENWSLGGNINDIKNEYSSISLKKDLLERKKSLIERNYELGSLLRKERFGTIETHEVSLLEMLKKETGYNDIQNNLITLDTQGELPHDEAFRMYQSLWGEQQARATSYRMQMSVQERMRESWTETLARVEGEYGEPILKYGSTYSEARVLEERYLDKRGNVDYSIIEAEGIDRMPKFFTSYEKFDAMFKNKVSDRKALIRTPLGEILIDTRYAFNHLTNNTTNENRTKYSGAIIKVFEDPLFIIEDIHEETLQKVYYKPFMSKNKNQGIVDLAGFTLDNNGNMVNTTFFALNENKLIKFIECREDRLLYYKHAGPSISAGTPEEGKTRANDESITKNKNDVKSENRNYQINPNILEKNDYGLRHIEKVLSIIPDGMRMPFVKEYLLFNGITHEHLRGSLYQDCLNGNLFINPIKEKGGILEEGYQLSSYYKNGGEVEARKIEELYMEMDLGAKNPLGFK